MPYEIPQELQYKEKIVFGLTFEQLAYAVVFLPVGLLFFFKLPLPLYVRAVLALIPSCLGLLFMFFDFKRFVANAVLWLRFRKAEYMSVRMQRFLGLQKVEGSVLYLRQKKSVQKVSVLRIEPVNFSIKNEEEKSALISGFQKFLNSLTFPVQVVMGTDRLNLDAYFKALETRVESVSEMTGCKSYFELFRSYSAYLEQVVSNKGIMNRVFYLVIPESSASELSIQVSICQDKLRSIDVKSSVLEGDELVKALSSFFNDVLEDDERSKFTNQKINGQNMLHYLVAPKFLKNVPDKVQVNGEFARIIYVHGYPRSVEAGFLDKVVTLDADFDLSLFIEPFPVESMMVMLNKELQKQRADLYAGELKGVINPSLEIKYKDTKSVLENLQKGNEKLFNVSFYVNCRGKSAEELDLVTHKIEAELNSLMLIPRRALFRMASGLKSCAPFGVNELGMRRNITTAALSAFFPFTSRFLQADETGVWIGLSRTGVPIIKDVFSLINPNGLILASSGAGKSYMAKLFISRHLLNGTRVIVIDPQSEYVELVKKFNGQLITISRSSETVINPLDLMGHDYAEKRLALMDLLVVMLGEVSEIQKSVLDRALTSTYEKKGITNEARTWSNKPPILADLLRELERMEKPATQIEKPTYRSLINRLSMYVTGVFSFLNRHTRVDVDNHFVCFNIGDMPRQVKPVVMFLILDFVYMKMRRDKERKLLVVDEAWSLLGRSEDASYIFEIVKTSRKFNLGLLLITQDVADLLKSDAGSAVLANTSYTLLLKQKPAVIEEVVRTFRLSSAEKERLLIAGVGEGLLLMENEHTEVQIVASEEEHGIITTNPDQLLLKEQPPVPVEQSRAVEISVDADKGFYRKADVKSEEVAYLLDKGYVLSSHVPLGGGRQEDYLLKPTGNQGATHFFLVRAVAEYIESLGGRPIISDTVKPDVVFESNRKKLIAVEVETGVTVDKRKDLIEKKVEELNKGYSEWFFVVAEAPYAYKYATFGQTFTRKNVCRRLRSFFKKMQHEKVGLASTKQQKKRRRIRTA